MNKPVCEATGPRCPSTSPATTCHTHDALGPETCKSSSLSNPRYHGSQRFSAAGKFIHTWIISELSARLEETLWRDFSMFNATTSRHPLDTAGTSDEGLACGIAVYHFALKHKRQRLKPFVRMGPKRQPSIHGGTLVVRDDSETKKDPTQANFQSGNALNVTKSAIGGLQGGMQLLDFSNSFLHGVKLTPIPATFTGPLRKTPRPRCSQQI